MMKIAVIAKTGTIAQGRWVRLTGVQKDGIWEVELPGPGRRAHAIILPHPKSAISPTDYGHAMPLGPIVEVEAGGVVAVDDDVTPDATGTVKKAPAGDRRCVGVAVTKGAMGKPFLMMLRWAGRP
jgi:hypothetical protein